MVGVQEIMTAAEFLHSKRDSHELGDNLTIYLRNRNFGLKVLYSLYHTKTTEIEQPTF